MDILMRDFKFRVWSEQLKRWLTKEEWYIDFDGNIKFLDLFPESTSGPCGPIINRDLFIIQQYIGVLDKNEKQIYEGDIVEWDQDIGEFVSLWKKIRGVVEWNEDWCHFIVKTVDSNDGYPIGVLSLTNYEIIGNLIEDKEKLKYVRRNV